MGIKKKIINEDQMDKITPQLVFKRYSNEKNQIDETGLSLFLQDVFNIDQQNMLTFMLLTICMGAPKMGHISFDHFTKMFVFAKAKDIGELKKAVPRFIKMMNEQECYKTIYMKTFEIFLVQDKTLDFQFAMYLWKILLSHNFVLWAKFQQFIKWLGPTRPSRVYKDLWMMLYEFAFKVHDIEKDYSMDAAWPVLFDSFIQYLNRQKK